MVFNHPALFFIMLLTDTELLFLLECKDHEWFTKKRFTKTQLNSDLIDSVINVADKSKVAAALGCYFNCTGIFLESDAIIKLLIEPVIAGTVRNGLYYFAEAAGRTSSLALKNVNKYYKLSKRMTDAIFNNSCYFYFCDNIGNFIFDLTDINRYLSTPRGRDIMSSILDMASIVISNVSYKNGNTVFDIFYHDYFVGNRDALIFFTENFYLGPKTISSKITKMLWDSNIFTEEELRKITYKALNNVKNFDASKIDSFMFSKTFMKTISPFITEKIDPGSGNAYKIFNHFAMRGMSIKEISAVMRLDRIGIINLCSCSKISDDEIEAALYDESLEIKPLCFSELDKFSELRPKLYLNNLGLIIEKIAITSIMNKMPKKIDKYIRNDLIDVSVNVTVDIDAIALLEELDT